MRARSVLCLVGGGSLLLGLLASPALAEPAPNQGRCVSELARAGLIGRDLNPGKANFVVGTEGDDVFDAMVTDDVDVICGFGGNDRIETLDAGDVFLGGEGDDLVPFNRGTFIGGEGNDFVAFNFGTFNGGPGDDVVAFNESGAVFNGGPGNDQVDFNFGTFNGDAGDDSVIFNESGGVFNGGPGNDTVAIAFPGSTFNQ
ncbi:MAG TPA: hypothetical protein VHG90_14530 [Acidimicrobiales bacterium]|nr:hypothetical protein [Acidimicrobiales bacterium]